MQFSRHPSLQPCSYTTCAPSYLWEVHCYLFSSIHPSWAARSEQTNAKHRQESISCTPPCNDANYGSWCIPTMPPSLQGAIHLIIGEIARAFAAKIVKGLGVLLTRGSWTCVEQVVQWQTTELTMFWGPEGFVSSCACQLLLCHCRTQAKPTFQDSHLKIAQVRHIKTRCRIVPDMYPGYLRRSEQLHLVPDLSCWNMLIMLKPGWC